MNSTKSFYIYHKILVTVLAREHTICYRYIFLPTRSMSSITLLSLYTSLLHSQTLPISIPLLCLMNECCALRELGLEIYVWWGLLADIWSKVYVKVEVKGDSKYTYCSIFTRWKCFVCLFFFFLFFFVLVNFMQSSGVMSVSHTRCEPAKVKCETAYVCEYSWTLRWCMYINIIFNHAKVR